DDHLLDAVQLRHVDAAAGDYGPGDLSQHGRGRCSAEPPGHGWAGPVCGDCDGDLRDVFGPCRATQPPPQGTFDRDPSLSGDLHDPVDFAVRTDGWLFVGATSV